MGQDLDGGIKQPECTGLMGGLKNLFGMCAAPESAGAEPARPDPAILGNGTAYEAGTALQGRHAQLEAMEKEALGISTPGPPKM